MLLIFFSRFNKNTSPSYKPVMFHFLKVKQNMQFSLYFLFQHANYNTTKLPRRKIINQIIYNLSKIRIYLHNLYAYTVLVKLIWVKKTRSLEYSKFPILSCYFQYIMWNYFISRKVWDYWNAHITRKIDYNHCSKKGMFYSMVFKNTFLRSIYDI